MQPGRNVKKRRFDPTQQGPIWRNAIQKAASCTTGFWVWCLCCSYTGTKSIRKNTRTVTRNTKLGCWDKLEVLPLFTFLLLTLTDKWYKQTASKNQVYFSFSQIKEETHRPSAIRELFQNNGAAKDPLPACWHSNFTWVRMTSFFLSNSSGMRS